MKDTIEFYLQASIIHDNVGYMERKTFTLVMEPDLHKQVKIAAAGSGKKMQEWVQDALRAALPANGKAKR